MTTTTATCPATHPEDQRPCEGQSDAVRIVDGVGAETLACLRHGATLLASLDDARVYPVTGSAIEVFRRACRLRPFDFTDDAQREESTR